MHFSKTLLAPLLVMLGMAFAAANLSAQAIHVAEPRRVSVMSTGVAILLVVLLIAVVAFFILRRTRGGPKT